MKKIYILLLILFSFVSVYAQNNTGVADGFSYFKRTSPLFPVPELSTDPVTGIMGSTATSGGTITTGNGSITAKGIVWSTSTTPTTGSHAGGGITNDGTGTDAFSSTLTSLLVNRQYFVRAYATSSSGTGYGNQQTFYTLANTPSAPTVNNATTSTLDVNVNVNGNPASTLFSIFETGGFYVSYPSGTLGSTPDWQTDANWGTMTVTGLNPNTGYSFSVQAQNGDGTVTGFSATTSRFTLAKTPLAPTVFNPTSTSLNLMFPTDGNPSWTLYEIKENGGQFVQSPSGTLGVAEEWRTITNWGTTVSINELSPETRYIFSTQAINGDGVETGFGGTTSYFTYSEEPTEQASNFLATATSPTQINLTWTAATFPLTGASVTGYVLLRSEGTNIPAFNAVDGQAPAAGGSTSILSATLANTVTSYSDSPLSSGTKYNYLLIPFSWNGVNSETYNYLLNSAPTATATTPYPDPTNHVTNFRTGFVNHNSAQLLWTDAIGTPFPPVVPAEAYLIRGSDLSFAAIVDPVDGTPVIDGALDKNIASGTQSCTFTGLAANTTYYFKIYPYRGTGANMYFKTDGVVPNCTATPTLRDVIWVADYYCSTCANDGHLWIYDAFDNMTDALAALIPSGGIIHTNGEVTAENLNLTNTFFTIGSHDLYVNGTITGNGYIETGSTGFLVLNTNGTVTSFPVGFNGLKYEVQVQWDGGGSSEEVKVRVNADNTMQLSTISGNLWFIEGPVGKNATLVLKIPKAVYAGVLPQDKFLLNGGGSTWTEHQYTVDSTTEPDYFIITITGINEF